MNRSAASSWLLLLACNLMWALQFTCIKLVQGQVGSFFSVWCPMTLAMLMLYPLVRRERAAGVKVEGVGPKPNLVRIYLCWVCWGWCQGKCS